MTIQYWPPALPPPVMSYSAQTEIKRIESGFDVAPKEKVTHRNYINSATLSWQFSEKEYQVFRAWHFYKLHDGADWFRVDWLKACRCRFTASYTTTVNQGHYAVSISAEVDYAVS